MHSQLYKKVIIQKLFYHANKLVISYKKHIFIQNPSCAINLIISHNNHFIIKTRKSYHTSYLIMKTLDIRSLLMPKLQLKKKIANHSYHTNNLWPYILSVKHFHIVQDGADYNFIYFKDEIVYECHSMN